MPDQVACSQPKPTDNPTPYGQWVCSKGYWKWIPEFGRIQQTTWNNFLYFFMSK